MKKSPGALSRRPSNSQRRTMSSSGAPARRRHRSTWRGQGWGLAGRRRRARPSRRVAAAQQLARPSSVSMRMPAYSTPATPDCGASPQDRTAAVLWLHQLLRQPAGPSAARDRGALTVERTAGCPCCAAESTAATSSPPASPVTCRPRHSALILCIPPTAAPLQVAHGVAASPRRESKSESRLDMGSRRALEEECLMQRTARRTRLASYHKPSQQCRAMPPCLSRIHDCPAHRALPHYHAPGRRWG